MKIEIYEAATSQNIDELDLDTVPQIGAVLCFDIDGHDKIVRYRVVEVEHRFEKRMSDKGNWELETKQQGLALYVEQLR